MNFLLVKEYIEDGDFVGIKPNGSDAWFRGIVMKIEDAGIVIGQNCTPYVNDYEPDNKRRKSTMIFDWNNVEIIEKVHT